MRRVVRENGLVVIYEHNPWNPLTRLAVARCEFDVGVTLLRPLETQRLLQRHRAPALETRYIGFFPWRKHLFRAVERRIARVPFGAQYVAVGRARDADRHTA
jgi:hypothetical protein